MARCPRPGRCQQGGVNRHQRLVQQTPGLSPLRVHCLRRLSERNLAVEGHGDQDPLERRQRVESSSDGLEGLVHLSLALNVGLVAIVGEAAVCLVIQVVVHARRPGRLGGLRLADLPYREPGRRGELILSPATGLLCGLNCLDLPPHGPGHVVLMTAPVENPAAYRPANVPAEMRLRQPVVIRRPPMEPAGLTVRDPLRAGLAEGLVGNRPDLALFAPPHPGRRPGMRPGIFRGRDGAVPPSADRVLYIRGGADQHVARLHCRGLR